MFTLALLYQAKAGPQNLNWVNHSLSDSLRLFEATRMLTRGRTLA